MVKRLLKRDDRIDGLQRDILRMAEESKKSGGIMLFSELLVRLDDLGWSTGSDEIEDIINNMSKEGLIQGLSPLESGTMLVEFVPVALTNDPQLILDLAAQSEGKLSLEEAVIGLGWTERETLVGGGSHWSWMDRGTGPQCSEPINQQWCCKRTTKLFEKYTVLLSWSYWAKEIAV